MTSTQYVTHNLHVPRGVEAPAQDRALPQVDELKPWQPGILDRIGISIQRHAPIMGGAAFAGAAAGGFLAKKILHRGIPATLLGLGVGAFAGAMLGALALGAFGANNYTVGKISSNAQPAAEKAGSAEKLRVMTFNVRGGMGPTGFGTTNKDLDAIAATIEAEHPDIVLLQEVDRFAIRSSKHDILQQLSDRLHPTSAVATEPMVAVTGRAESVAVMTFNGNRIRSAQGIIHSNPRGGNILQRLRGAVDLFATVADDAMHNTVASSTAKRLGARAYDVRSSLDTLIETKNGNDVRVVTGHYDTPNAKHPDALNNQEITLSQLLAAFHGPTIYGGDFNAQSEAAEGRRLSAELSRIGLMDSFTSRGIAVGDDARNSFRVHSQRPTDIDRIFSSHDFAVQVARVVQTADAVSDHQPVVTDLMIRP